MAHSQDREEGPPSNDANGLKDTIPTSNTFVQTPGSTNRSRETALSIRVDSEVPKEHNRDRDQDQTPPDVSPSLPEDKAAIIRRQLDVLPSDISYFSLYRYATKNDILVLTVSAICAIAAGAAMPLMTVIFGSLTGKFGDFVNNTDQALARFETSVNTLTLYLVYLAIGEAVTVYVSTVGFIYAGENISAKIRENYLRSILRQNIGFFDKLGAGEITIRITSNTNLIQEGISEKVGLTLTAVATFVSAYVIGFVRYWKLTLILTSAIVAIVLTMAIVGGIIIKFTKESLTAYAVGGTVVEEVISSIRNAVAFGTQDKLAKEYDTHLKIAEKGGFKAKALTGSMVGFILCFLTFGYALAFWLGGHYVTSGETGLSQVITIILAVQMAAFSLGNVAPHAQAFSTAVSAAAEIFATIDRSSPLDPESDEGEKPEAIEGYLKLSHVRHIYPSRPEVVVMEDFDLTIPAGKTTALVGASGSGKSTIIGLLERFYDPVGGAIFLDGYNVQTLNLRWLRQQIGLVSQETTLFATTIANNIRYGLIGTIHETSSDELTFGLVEKAARIANSHDFISQLPEGYDTNIGERGFLLSGGQKQRIAIARAIIGDPKVLLLDEATSALDTKSEGVVQAALDKAAKGRTTIVIAHRLNTIRHADNIVVMSQGRIVEQGIHDVLMKKQEAYYRLVEAQNIASETEEDRKLETGERLEKEEEEEKETTDPNRVILTRTNSTQFAPNGFVNDKTEAKKIYSLWTLIQFIASFNKAEWYWMATGLTSSILAGAVQPVQAVIYAKSIDVLSLGNIPSQKDHVLAKIGFWSWMYFMTAFVLLFAFCVQGISFAFCSERLVHRSRDRAFRTILRQDVAFFDREENTAGALTSLLNTETAHMAGMSGVTLGTILQLSTTLIISYIISLAFGWKLALVCLSTVPIVLGCGFLRVWMLARFQTRATKAYEKSASYACEAISAIRTVASLTREHDIWKNYHKQLELQASKSLISVLKSSTLYAASQSFLLLCNALGFWYGSKLIASREYDLFVFILVFTAIIFGSQSAGVIFSSAPDMAKAKHAAETMKKLFDGQPSIDTWSESGQVPGGILGSIEFRDVHFRYPTRPEVPVLRSLNLSVQPGQYVGLVGASGCGKSTLVSLLERFYDPLAGGIYVDGQDISSLNVNAYRKHLALVSQEPTLYQGTIRENILLGTDRKPEDVPEEVVIQACKDANIHDFIVSLPEGFSTVCGSKGVLLSGGQKQRIAVARALLRDPKILLFDEATSALDSESEKIVQAALDKVASGRTTIAVAHRLSTTQTADIIYVLDQGQIVEQGTHQELIQKGGKYFELVNLQSLGENA
ncbi:putative Leptomycin B resistance protein pmd1 [Cadophora sp. MPI-SDFR-AT-0126]|nr:putative Leptomycin B resistance protein pmd1 [Leotiomycetes sp. MPI-SDFR-AT-0126]